MPRGWPIRKEALLFEKRSKNFCLLARALLQLARLLIKSFGGFSAWLSP
jgi:hypothetical protein